MGVFARFLDVLFPPRDTERTVREATQDTLPVSPTLVSIPQGEAVALLPYRQALPRALIVEGKFHKSERAQALLGGVLADYLLESAAEARAFSKHPIVLVPIPLSKKRQRVRGYNQVERICAVALPLLYGSASLATETLYRTRDTVPQTDLSREARLENMTGAFGARAVDPFATYIIVDDVVTTGATLSAAQGALIEAGATSVLCVALAH